MKKIIIIMLLVFSTSVIAETPDMKNLNNTVNSMGASLKILCTQYMPKNSKELKTYVEALKKQENPDQKVKTFIKVFGFCIEKGFISREVLK